MRGLFRQEGFLWRALNAITDIFALSGLFLVCSLPVVTAGASLTALYDSVTRCVRYKEPAPYQRFWNTFKKELKTGVLFTLLWGALIAAFVLARSLLSSVSAQSSAAVLIGAVYYVFMLVPVGAFCWSCAILSRFTYTFRELSLTALRFVFYKLPVTVLLVIMSIEALELILNHIFPAFFLPAVLMLLWSLFVERVFGKLGGGLKKYGAEPEPEKTPGETEETLPSKVDRS